jgi:hypothetical protein
MTMMIMLIELMGPKEKGELGIVANTHNSSSWEAEAAGLRVLDSPGLHSKNLSKKRKRKEGREGGRGRKRKK